jgi:hypothetical protein
MRRRSNRQQIRNHTFIIAGNPESSQACLL